MAGIYTSFSILKNEKEICQAYFIQICNDEIRVRLCAFTGLLTRIESAYCRQLPGAGAGRQDALSFALLRQFYRFCGLTVAQVRRQGGSGGRQSAAGPPTPALLRILPAQPANPAARVRGSERIAIL